MVEKLHISNPLWRWTGAQNGSWFFVSIHGDAGGAISAHALMRRLETGRGRGFGSVRVHVTLGSSRWRTSVFPSKEHGWIVPIKGEIRRTEAIGEGDIVGLMLELD